MTRIFRSKRMTQPGSSGVLLFYGGILTLSNSCVGAGVTLITHGFSGNVNDWIIPMAQKIPEYYRFPGTNFSCYEISFVQDGQGNYVPTQSRIGGVAPTSAESGEIIVKLDWSLLPGELVRLRNRPKWRTTFGSLHSLSEQSVRWLQPVAQRRSSLVSRNDRLRCPNLRHSGKYYQHRTSKLVDWLRSGRRQRRLL